MRFSDGCGFSSTVNSGELHTHPPLGPQALPFTGISNLAPRHQAWGPSPPPLAPGPLSCLPATPTAHGQQPKRPANPPPSNWERTPFSTGSGSSPSRSGRPAPLAGAGPAAGSALSLSPRGRGGPVRRGRTPAAQAPWWASPRAVACGVWVLVLATPRGTPACAPGLLSRRSSRRSKTPTDRYTNLGLSPLPRSKQFICERPDFYID